MSTDVEPYAAAAADAASRGLAVSFVARTPGQRPAPVEGVELVKTIVVQTKDRFVLVLTPVDAQFSWAKLRAHLGVNKLSLPDADGAFAATGYVRGTITPLGAAGSWPVVVDARLAGRRIAIGSGSAEFGALVSADELVRAYSAAVVDLAAE
ncbi:aminoacyl-tRNA deacylase [Leucobacter manosquensis]|uniref:YbaK/EbsC family protein n=1 Tax=Leucobacter manosquensis TaxID=2810611 RepID=A0ABS5M440_9MICO|nr:YbaK/EbsC family protein [Leucobacter manosquensis]MBS3181937.1 YbaK/EbsC family protein [Leucobacter manosquensis]